MARKKSERYRFRYRPNLRVRDGRRILGVLVVLDAVKISQDEGITLKRGPRFALIVDNSPATPVVTSPADDLALAARERQKRERRPRTITQDKGYIRFPDFVIRAEKLLPIVRKVIEGGMREIEYSSLRRLLGM